MAGTLEYSRRYTLSGTGSGAGTQYAQAKRPDGSNASGVDGSYASLDELFEFGLTDNVRHDFKPSNLEAQLRRASREADSMVGHRFDVPLRAYSEAWVGWVCDMASYFAMERRGWKPGEEGKDQEQRFVRKFNRAVANIKAAQDYMITPDRRLLNVTGDPQPAAVASGRNRGWSR